MKNHSFTNIMKAFLKIEAAPAILLGLAAILAIIIENSPLKNLYDHFLNIPIAIQIGFFGIDKPIFLWINDGLMAIFFFLIGLEIKREILQGQLSTKDQLILPIVAALGGLAVPALIYSYFNWGDQYAMNGWAIPVATDIAFALGVMTLLGKKVPESLKICLMAIAIIDDLASIVIIALFYTKNISFIYLGFALVSTITLYIMNRRGVINIKPYILVGIFLWACVLKSGIHATLAGVLVALSIPLRAQDKLGKSPALSLEHALHPWVAYGVLPIFAFANSGVSLKGLSFEHLLHPITLGIALGLFFGKQIGIILLTSVCVVAKMCRLPNDVNWAQYYAMSLVTGIGFTMSLFIGGLAFDNTQYQTFIRFGVISGSLLSGIFGYLLLKITCRKRSN